MNIFQHSCFLRIFFSSCTLWPFPFFFQLRVRRKNKDHCQWISFSVTVKILFWKLETRCVWLCACVLTVVSAVCTREYLVYREQNGLLRLALDSGDDTKPLNWHLPAVCVTSAHKLSWWKTGRTRDAHFSLSCEFTEFTFSRCLWGLIYGVELELACSGIPAEAAWNTEGWRSARPVVDPSGDWWGGMIMTVLLFNPLHTQNECSCVWPPDGEINCQRPARPFWGDKRVLNCGGHLLKHCSTNMRY